MAFPGSRARALYIRLEALPPRYTDVSNVLFRPFQPSEVYDLSRNKAVAFGAVSHYVNHFVTGRLVKYTYGAIACAGFDQLDPEHRRRSEKKRLTMTGEFILEVFTPILLKVSGIQLAPRSN